MNNIILDSLDYYFARRTQHEKKIKLLPDMNENMPIALVDNVKMKYNIIGVLYKSSLQFTWAWNLNIKKVHYVKTKQLLVYGVNIDVKTLQDTYIKTLLTSSTINLLSVQNIYILIALSTYLTKAITLVQIENDDQITYCGLYDIDDNET